jgi:hypothetical protein
MCNFQDKHSSIVRPKKLAVFEFKITFFSKAMELIVFLIYLAEN